MSSGNTQPPRRFRPLIFLAALGVVCFVGYEVAHHRLGSRSETPIPVAGQASNPAPALASRSTNNLALALKPAAPGTVVTAESVLDKLDKWMAENPNYHAIVETVFPNGSMMGKLDVYSYTNEGAGNMLRIKGEVLTPLAVQFVAQKENGKLQVYFPKTNRLLEPDNAKMLGSIPALGTNPDGMKPLLKLARSTFAEASADLEVATLVISSEALKLPETSGDIYLSVRINNQGKLLGIEEQAAGQRIISNVKFVTFDRVLVARDAPALPAGKTPVSDKTLQEAMQDEAHSVINKPLGTKI